MSDLTKTQKKQINFLDSLEFNPFLSMNWIGIIVCKDCKADASFSAPSSVQYWIKQHAGHQTWLTTRN